MSRVLVRREPERRARMKLLEVCRRREMGVQERKVLLERKVLKNLEQVGAVKLLPREVSKGEGIGAVISVMEGEGLEDVVVGASVEEEDEDEGVSVAEEASEEASEEVEVVEAIVVEEVVSETSCRRSSQF